MPCLRRSVLSQINTSTSFGKHRLKKSVAFTYSISFQSIDWLTTFRNIELESSNKGSFLGPFLFNISISDLDDRIDEILIRFVDNIKLGQLTSQTREQSNLAQIDKE